jgi:hypothetical protein
MSNETKEPEIVDECEPLPCFKRNNYFYGKLLTVSDFQVEQQYYVNKFRLINRLIHGAGVVCGLKVLYKGAEAPDLSEGSIRITEGVALDFCGREIVVSEREDKDVEAALKQKYPGFKGPGDFYVWIKYDSCGDEKVPKVLEASTCQEECCYSRIKESYRIEVDKSVPEPWGTSEGDVCARWNEFVADPTKYEFFFKNCLDCLDEAVIVLAKITVSTEEDGSIVVKTVNNAVDVEPKQRKLVYSNDRLYTLIECLRKRIEDLKKKTDFPKITEITWPHDHEYSLIDEWAGKMKEGFQITFSEFMTQSTINSRTLSLTLEETSQEGKRVRILRNEIPVEIGFSEQDKVKSVSVRPNKAAADYEKFFSAESLKEQVLKKPIQLRLIIQLRGDFVYSVEKERKCLDGNFLRGDLGQTGSGNGCEGGLFESWVRLKVERTAPTRTVATRAKIIDIVPKPLVANAKEIVTVQIDPGRPEGESLHGLRLTITNPDGALETHGPFDANNIGMGYTDFTPNARGTYTLQLDYPGETFESTMEYYAPSKSEIYRIAIAGGGLYALPTLMVALKNEGTDAVALWNKMESAKIETVEDLAEVDTAEIKVKLGVSDKIATALKASGKSAKDLKKVEGMDSNMVRELMAGGTTSAKTLAKSTPEKIMSVLRITKDEAEALRAKAARVR